MNDTDILEGNAVLNNVITPGMLTSITASMVDLVVIVILDLIFIQLEYPN